MATASLAKTTKRPETRREAIKYFKNPFKTCDYTPAQKSEAMMKKLTVKNPMQIHAYALLLLGGATIIYSLLAQPTGPIIFMGAGLAITGIVALLWAKYQEMKKKKAA